MTDNLADRSANLMSSLEELKADIDYQIGASEEYLKTIGVLRSLLSDLHCDRDTQNKYLAAHGICSQCLLQESIVAGKLICDDCLDKEGQLDDIDDEIQPKKQKVNI